MKKIIAFSLALLAAATVFAQNSREEARRVILGQKKTSSSKDSRDVVLGGGRPSSYPNTYPTGNYPYSSRAAQIDAVNREYDYKIQTIRNNRALSARERDRIIRDLNNQRNARIRQINAQYSNHDSQHKDYKNKKYKNYKKHENGKHLGWYKGKGNPHKHDKD